MIRLILECDKCRKEKSIKIKTRNKGFPERKDLRSHLSPLGWAYARKGDGRGALLCKSCNKEHGKLKEKHLKEKDTFFSL